jgi:hypothetical protein
MPWQPDPSWKPMTAGAGQSNGGVWLTPDQRVVKRLLPGVEDQRHHAYWRRQAEVAASGIVATTPGVRSPGCVRVDRDADGITLWMTEVEAVTHEPLELARALGRFGSARIAEPEWGTRGILRDRLARVTRRGGWVGSSRRASRRLCGATFKLCGYDGTLPWRNWISCREYRTTATHIRRICSVAKERRWSRSTGSSSGSGPWGARRGHSVSRSLGTI